VERLTGLQTTPQAQGILSKYAKTYARDAINDFMGQRNRIIDADLGTEWYMYVGSNLTTTREFCEHLTKKKYVHKSEIPTILEGDIDGHQCEIYDKTGLPHGLIDGTDPDNFIIYRGGWNCGHQLIPVAEEAVPDDVRKGVVGYIATGSQTEKLPFDNFKGKIIKIEKPVAINKLHELNETANYEESYTFLKDGTVYHKQSEFGYAGKGAKTKISFNSHEQKLFKDAELYHNHPDALALSPDDIFFMIKNDLKSISAISTDGKTYTMVNKKNLKNNELLKDVFSEQDSRKAKVEFMKLYNKIAEEVDEEAGELDSKKYDEFLLNPYHYYNRKFSQKLGLKYLL
jgi:hypothetical protein